MFDQTIDKDTVITIANTLTEAVRSLHTDEVNEQHLFIASLMLIDWIVVRMPEESQLLYITALQSHIQALCDQLSERVSQRLQG